MAIVAVLVASGFEQADMTALCGDLAAARHVTRVVSPKKQMARAWDNTRWNGDIPVDVAVTEAHPQDFDAVIVPGGLISADTLRADTYAVDLVAGMAAGGKLVGAMGHSGWVLVEAGLTKGRRVTSHPAIRSDMENAGATWQDSAVVEDGGLVTGRHGHDIREFVAAVARQL